MNGIIWNLILMLGNLAMMVWSLSLGNVYLACFNSFAAGVCFMAIIAIAHNEMS